MSRDVITVGSTMRISLLYRGKYSQWRERFMNYLEEQTDGEAMINSIQNGDHPLRVVAQVSFAGTAPNAIPTLKDPNNETAKDLWDALERQKRVSEYGEQDRKAAILYEYETFKATEGEQLLDAYLRCLQVINDLKKCGYKKDKCELNYKFLNNLQPEWKQYGTLMRQTKNLIDINIDALYNILKQNQGDVNDSLGYKKKAVVVTSDPLALVAKKTKITALLAKDFNQKKYYPKPTNNNLRTYSASSSTNKKLEYVKSVEKKEDKKVDKNKRDISKKLSVIIARRKVILPKTARKQRESDQEINENMVFMAKLEKVLSDSDESSSSAEETIVEIIQIYLWIIDSGCSKHMIGNRVLLTNFVENFLGTVRFGNNDFVVIAGYGDVVIGSITIKKVYYVEGLGHNLFSVGQFCDKGLEVAFRKSTCSVRTEDGVDLVISDRSSNLYTISLNEVASNSSACLLAKASSSQSWLWHQRLSQLNFATINNRVKNNLVQGLPKMKFKKDHLCSACKQGKIHRKYHKSKMAFASNKPLYLLHMDLCGPMRVESINGKRYVLVVVDDYSRYTWDVRKLKEKGDIEVFVGYSKESAAFRIYNKQTRKIHESVNVNFNEISEMASKQFSLEPGLSNLNETGKSSNQSISKVLETSKKYLEDLFQNFYDEYFDSSNIMKSSTTNIETSNVEIPSNEEEVFHGSSESFQEGYSLSSLNDDVYQSLEEVAVPSSNTQSVSNNMVSNVDEVSTSHNVFNERLEDAYFDASTSFHDSFSIHTFFQPYPHEKKWTKDHPLHKIIGDPKSSVRTRGQLANSCLFLCLLSSIEPANVAEALRDVDWVSAMQE
nr:integrase, catalytic region, zinc finger, CCHC-type, peptidase aspartic, catalytic [Tanacetum cinerariifolium]